MIVNATFTVNGVLTDPTSAVLSDPTASFGVRRTDTGGVIVAAGTAMTKTSTGIYTYTFAEPVPGLTYEAWPTMVYAGQTYTTQKFLAGTPVQPTQAQAAGLLTISAARRKTRFYSRNAGDPTQYPTEMLDFAIQRAANYLIREAHLCLRTDAQDTVANQSAYAVTGTSVVPFRCERLDSAFLSGPNVVVSAPGMIANESHYVRGGMYGFSTQYRTARLEIIDYTDLNDMLIAQPTQGQPQCIAFQNDGTYALWPIPDQVYTVNRRWSDWFTPWAQGVPLTSFTNTAGVLSNVVVVDGSDNQGASMAGAFSDSGGGAGATATPTVTNGSLVSVAVGGSGGTGYTAATQLLLNGFNSADQGFNLPDDLLYEVLSLGAPAFLQFNDPEKAFATAKGAEFREFVKQVAGRIGGLGVKRIVRRV